MPDFDAIAVALAGRFDPAQVTPPAGYDPIRLATADLPGQMTPLPTVLVFLDQGTFDTGAGSRQGGHDFLVRFYYDQAGDLARAQVALRRWLTILADQLRTSVQLGGIVATARVMGWKIGQLGYAGETYEGLELRVRIVTTEGWAASA